jgi:hypothetical protein
MRQLGEEFVRAGHEPVLVTAGPRLTETVTAFGLHVELAGPPVPGLGSLDPFAPLDPQALTGRPARQSDAS